MAIKRISIKGGYRFRNFAGKPAEVLRELPAAGSVRPEPIPGFSVEWENLDTGTIGEILVASGTQALDRSGIPTRGEGSKVSPDRVTDIIIQGIEADLFPVSPAVLLRGERLAAFGGGCRILEKVMPRARLHIVMNRGREDLLLSAGSAAGGAALYAIKPAYPAARDEVLVPAVLGRPFPYGFSTPEIGVVVLSIATVLHVFDAVTAGKSVTERILVVGGAGITEPVHVKAAVGTPVREILAAVKSATEGVRFVVNSLLSGDTITDLDTPVRADWTGIMGIPDSEPRELLPFASPGFTKDSYTNTFLALALPWVNKRYSTNLRGEERACLSCSYCAEVCPSGILPNLLHKYVAREIIDETLQRFRIFDCIDCNLCTYVCPSKIPVAELMAEGKRRLEAEGITDEARIRAAFPLIGAVGSEGEDS